jgi:hypothetical protein
VAKLRLEVGLRSRGASLRTIGRELRDMDERKVTGIFRDALEPVARRYVPRVRASVMAIPVIPEGKQTGLRARVAACAETATWGSGREVNVAVEINPQRMPPGEMGLPLYMEGIPGGRINHARWRHMVYGNPDVWVTQESHPYFDRGVAGYGRAGGEALKAALEDITRKFNG